MSERREHLIYQQRLRELCAATVRSLAGDGELHFRGQQLFRGPRRVPIHAPHLRLHDAFTEAGEVSAAPDRSSDLFDLRAVMDGVALRLQMSNAQIHRQLSPRQPIAHLVFEMLEQFRV